MLNLIKFRGGVRALLFLALFALFSCSESSSDSDNSIPLSSPKIVQASATASGELTLQWTKVGAAQGVAPEYEVWQNTADDLSGAQHIGTVQSDASNLVKKVITGLTNDVKYYFWVRAVYGSLGKAAFSPVCIGTPAPPAEAPANLTAQAGETLLWLTWGKSLHANSYEIAYSTVDNGAAPGDSDPRETAYIPRSALNGLSDGVTYYIWVRGVNTAGSSDWVKTSAAPAAASAKPSKPYITEVIAGNKRLTVTWTADISAAAYTLHYSGDGESGSINVEPTPISVTGTIPSLTNGKVYTVYVVACNSQGDSDQSNNDYGIPEDISVPIDFNNLKFTLGTADAEYIFVHNLPKSPAFSTGRPGTDRLTRVRETALGNLFTDGAAWYVREKLGEDIDFVFLNGGYIDNALAAGQITTGALAAMVDVDSREYTFTILTLKGSAVKELFDFSANVVHTGRGSSGTGAWGIVSEEVNYTIDYPVFTPAEIASPANPPSRPLEDYRHGEIRNGSLKINGADIVDSNDYRIAVASSLAEGQEGYLVFPINAKNIRETTIPFWHGVAEYIYDQGSITPYLDGRIKIYGGVPLGDLQEPYNDPSYTFVP